MKKKQPTNNITADYDVIIIGAGVSGIGTACHLSMKCPKKSYAILERRERIGGTWDLFRYPGIRSDSDMSTFGFNFRPWTENAVLADGEQIRTYLQETADEYRVTENIRFGCKVTAAKWSSSTQLWTVHFVDEKTGMPSHVTARHALACTGYYNYDKGYTPAFKGTADFKGKIIHPQFWPEDLDYTGKNVVIIGSGATAVTLLPAMADKTAKITMLQRSPSYIYAVPSKDHMAEFLRGKLPDLQIYRMARARNIALQRTVFELCKKYPNTMAKIMKKDVAKRLGKNFDMKHFTPDYKPWDQRICAVPDGDLFDIIKAGKAEVVTDHIDHFTETGIQLTSGEHLAADIIITATGLSLQIGGGSNFYVDEKPINFNEHLTYKGVLVEGVPNAAVVFGYTNSSWTLKSDIAAEYICRLLNYMDKKGYAVATPHDDKANLANSTVFGDITSGYVQRAAKVLPKQGKKLPWKVTHNYAIDMPMLRFSKINDEHLHFEKPHAKKSKRFHKKLGKTLRHTMSKVKNVVA